jgi:hypothetical protein
VADFWACGFWKAFEEGEPRGGFLHHFALNPLLGV